MRFVEQAKDLEEFQVNDTANNEVDMRDVTENPAKDPLDMLDDCLPAMVGWGVKGGKLPQIQPKHHSPGDHGCLFLGTKWQKMGNFWLCDLIIKCLDKENPLFSSASKMMKRSPSAYVYRVYLPET